MLDHVAVGRSAVAFEADGTLTVVIEMSLSSWLVAGVLPGVWRRPLKKLEPDEAVLLRLVEGWREEALAAGREIQRVVVAYEAGRDGFWLARWLRAREIEAYVIHPNSVAASRERGRAKTDRLDTALLLRVVLGWLRGEPGHCSMVSVPTVAEEDVSMLRWIWFFRTFRAH
jgi:transposase